MGRYIRSRTVSLDVMFRYPPSISNHMVGQFKVIRCTSAMYKTIIIISIVTHSYFVTIYYISLFLTA